MSVWNKIYERINWKDLPQRLTALAARNLNKMDLAIDTLDDRTIGLNTRLEAVEENPITVDTELKPDSENPVQNKVIYAAFEDMLPEETAEGNPISISDGSNIVPAKLAEVTFLPKQDLHGYDYPWVGGAGINKLANLKDGTYSGNGVTAIVKDGVATLSGTTTASGNAIIIPLDKAVTVPNQTCYIHSMNSAQNGSVQPSIEKNGDAPNTAIAFAFTPVNRITEIPQARYGVTVDQVRFYLASGVTLSGTFSPMICLTNTPSAFEPYSNICPISGRTGVNVYQDTEQTETPETTYTETLGATYYGGKVDFVSGECVINMEYRLLNGTENWQVANTGTANYYYYIALPSTSYAVNASIIADKFPQGNVTNTNTDFGIIHCTAGYIRVRPFDTEIAVTDWKTWLDSNNIQVVFELQNPTELTLTPQEIELLKGQNVLTTDGNSIKLVYSADIKAFIEKQLSV